MVSLAYNKRNPNQSNYVTPIFTNQINQDRFIILKFP